MAVNTITYTNKVTLNENPNIDAVNKCQANDMNEIKSVVNTNATGVGDISTLNTTATTVVGAINEINSGIQGTTTPITWSTGISEISDTENSIKINTIEKSCTLTFAVNRSTAIVSSFVIGTFSTSYAPSNLVIGAGIVAGAGTTTDACQVSIDSNGNININNQGHSSTTFRGQIKWYY